MLVDIMPLKILVSAGAPVAPGEGSLTNRMPELALAILGIEGGKGGGGVNQKNARSFEQCQILLKSMLNIKQIIGQDRPLL
jgi:hypothetical protein